MLQRTFAVVAALSAALLSTSTLATPRDEFRRLNSEGGISQYHYPDAATSKSREDVKAEWRAFQRSGAPRLTEASPAPTPSASRAAFSATRDAEALRNQGGRSDGWRDLGGEAGWIFERP